MKTIIIALVVVGVVAFFLYGIEDISYERESTVEVLPEVEVEEVSKIEQARQELEQANQKLDEEEARLKAEHDAFKAEWEAKEKAYKANLEEIKNLRVSFTQAPKQDN